jgi:hydroxypyruvate reductase
VADRATIDKAALFGMSPATYLARDDAYTFFAAARDLLVTGLTQTNVMDVRVLLVG